MPTFARSHEENLGLLCIIGLKKCGKGLRSLTKIEKDLIVKKVYSGFYQNESYLPGALCGKHRIILLSWQNDQIGRPIPYPNNKYDDLAEEMKNLPPLTRGSHKCLCEACHCARQTINPKPMKYLVEEVEEVVKDEEFLTCMSCGQSTLRTKTHNCGRATSKRMKAKRLVDQLSPESLVQLQTEIDKEIGTANKDYKVPTAALAEMMASGMSKNRAIGVGQVINSLPGIAMSPNYRKKLTGLLHQCDDYFEIRRLDLLVKNKNEDEEKESKDVLAEEPVYGVFCKDIPAFVEFILIQRGLTGSKIILKIGLDGGQGFLKVS